TGRCVCVIFNITQISGTKCGSYAGSELGVVVTPQGNEVVITL
ncbi:hypothetical protein LTSEWAN_5509, partial [Salmonella enterica subsp. enterica serovar Wandsworth str. A4-580]